MMRAWHKILLAVAILAAPALAHAETRVALVIGNSDYANVARLTNPANDAAAIAATLRKIGFTRVELKNDLGYDALRHALIAFAGEARGADVALVYYAGHGMEADHRNYLIPVDAQLATASSLDLEAVPLDNVLDAVEGARRLRIVILDACRNNPFARQMSNEGGRRAIGDRGLAPIEPAGDTLVVYSAKDGTMAEDGGGANSPFATALMNDLPLPGLEISLLFRKVHDDVMAATHPAQQPFVYGSLSAQAFYFIPPGTGSYDYDPDRKTPPASATDSRTIELAYWNSVSNSNDAAQLQSYIAQYPSGSFVPLANAKIAALNKPAQVAILQPAKPMLNALVQQAVDAARTAETQARERATAARRAQTLARQAAQQAAAGSAGYGVLTGTASGANWRWEGQVANNAVTGLGIFTYTSGSWAGQRYEGEELNGSRSGLGVYTFPTGERYEGEWRDNDQNGSGVDAGGSANLFREKAGQYANVQSNGYCVTYEKDGTVWLGSFKDSELSGYAAKLDEQGRVIEQGYYEASVLKTAMTP